MAKYAATKLSGKSSPSLASKAADQVQKGVAVVSEAAGRVVDSGKEAVTSMVTNTTSLEKNATSGADKHVIHHCHQ